MQTSAYTMSLGRLRSCGWVDTGSLSVIPLHDRSAYYLRAFATRANYMLELSSTLVVLGSSPSAVVAAQPNVTTTLAPP